MSQRFTGTPTAQIVVERALRATPSHRAVVDGDRTLSYGDLASRSARLANTLIAHGSDTARPASAWLPNSLEFIEFDVACTRAGVTRVGINERLSGDEARYILEQSGSAVLITNRDFLDRVEELPDSVELVICLDVVDGGYRAGRRRVLGYEAALGDASPDLRAVRVPPETPNYLLYTSGTTGRPKGASHSHAGRVASTLNMLGSELSFDRQAVMLHAGPLTHGSGSKVIAVLASGATNLILRKFDPAGVKEAVTSHGATHSFLVPTMLQRLLEAGPAVTDAIASMRQISFGGAPVSTALFSAALERFGPILTQVYGSSEAPHPVTLLRPADYVGETDTRTLTSAGRAALGVEVKVVDDHDAEVRAEDVGELLIAGHHLMLGYWRNPEATEAAFTRDGWYRTGDLASIAEDGLVTFRDRKRDLIISGGLNVYPSEVERVLAEHPGVHQVAVIGVPDNDWGEAVRAYVVPHTDWTPSGDDLVEWTRERIASYKKPRSVVFVESLPLGSTNKVLKQQLRDAVWEGHGRRIN